MTSTNLLAITRDGRRVTYGTSTFGCRLEFGAQRASGYSTRNSTGAFTGALSAINPFPRGLERVWDALSDPSNCSTWYSVVHSAGLRIRADD